MVESIEGAAYGTGEIQPLIYIVDDSEDYRFMVSLVFRRSLPQYRIQYFESGMALCVQVETDPVEVPCLILMDTDMPGLSGPQTLTILRQHPIWKDVPTIIISSSKSAEDQQMAYTSGANFYMQKPTTILALTEELGQLCHYWSKVGVGTRGSGC